MELIIVTGLSGAGKSQAMHCLEDLGYYCVDNIPPLLIRPFIDLAESTNKELSKVAFVVDIRGGEFFDDLKDTLKDLKACGFDYKIMFLDASDAVLIRRFSETRRTHPLAGSGSNKEGIEKEREKLSDLKKMASFVIDTSDLKAAGLNAEIQKLLSTEESETFSIMIESFGYKNGVPAEADWVLDARFLPNPYYVKSLKALTGNNKKIQDFVMKNPETENFIGRIVGLIIDTIPSYEREGKYRLVVAMGCTGGQHRSVVLANEIYRRLDELGKNVKVFHRDL